MHKNTKMGYSFKFPKRGTSLGLQTSASYELQLLEAAVRGRKVFENNWNEQATIDEQVMFLEILEEIQLQEKAGCNNLLLERSRNLVVRMKDQRCFHQRALVVYRDILCLRHSLTGTNCNSQQRECEVTDTSGSLAPDRNTESSSLQTLTLDEKFDEVMSLEFPDTEDDESSISIKFCVRKTQDQPSRTSCELRDKFDEVSGEILSIFKKPTLSFITPLDFIPDKLSEIDSNAKNFEGEDPTYTRQNQNIRSIQLCLGDEPPSKAVLRKTIEQNESKEFSDRDGIDEKIDNVDVKIPQSLSSFPERDFKFLLWTVDGVTYRAKSVADLRRKHNVLIEGAFRKRCRYHKWQSYYGFILETGVMIYFREGVFKKVADFRTCSHVFLKVGQCSLNIKDLRLASRVTNWIIKFASKKVCKTWYEIIVKISRNQKPEVSGIHDSLHASEYI